MSAFEQWQPPAEQFDVVVAATAFHWLDPGIRVGKAADVLRPGGVLATITTFHVAGSSSTFFQDCQACYRRWDPATTAGQRLPEAADIAFDSDEVDRSGRFGPATFHRYEHDVEYSTDAYIDTLMTYSGHRAMDPPPAEGCSPASPRSSTSDTTAWLQSGT